MFEVVNHRRAESALGTLEKKLVHSQDLKYQLVIEINKDELTNELVQYVLHQSLEGGRHVREAKQHDQELKVAPVRAKRRLMNVVGVHSDLVVSLRKSNLVKNLTPCRATHRGPE